MHRDLRQESHFEFIIACSTTLFISLFLNILSNIYSVLLQRWNHNGHVSQSFFKSLWKFLGIMKEQEWTWFDLFFCFYIPVRYWVQEFDPARETAWLVRVSNKKTIIKNNAGTWFALLGYISLSNTNAPTPAPPSPTLPNIHNTLAWVGTSPATGSCTFAGGVTSYIYAGALSWKNCLAQASQYGAPFHLYLAQVCCLRGNAFWKSTDWLGLG